MSLALAEPLRRVIDRLAAVDEAMSLAELARRLLALTAPPSPSIARRLLASALGSGAAELPDAVAVAALPRLLEGAVGTVPLEDAAWVVVDLETTGLSADRCAILEIGAVRIARLQAVARFQTLVDPGLPIPARITALTGIDRSLIEGAPPLARALDAFRAWVGEGPGVAFVAHNAAFDARFLWRAFETHGLAPWPGPVFCTRRIGRRLLPGLARYDLDSLSAHFGISNRWRHRALGDAEATARALLELLALGRAAGRVQTLGDLVQVQADPPPGRSKPRRARRPGVRSRPG